jgi:hypothetical protein
MTVLIIVLVTVAVAATLFVVAFLLDSDVDVYVFLAGFFTLVFGLMYLVPTTLIADSKTSKELKSSFDIEVVSGKFPGDFVGRVNGELQECSITMNKSALVCGGEIIPRP